MGLTSSGEQWRQLKDAGREAKFEEYNRKREAEARGHFRAVDSVLMSKVLIEKLQAGNAEFLNMLQPQAQQTGETPAEQAVVPGKVSSRSWLAKEAVAAVFFLWALPFSVSFCTSWPLAGDSVGGLEPRSYVLNFSGGVLVFGWWRSPLVVGVGALGDTTKNSGVSSGSSRSGAPRYFHQRPLVPRIDDRYCLGHCHV